MDSINLRENATENPTMPVDRKRKTNKPSRNEGPSDAEIKRFAEQLRPLILQIEEYKRIWRHLPHPHKPRFVTMIERHGKGLDQAVSRMLSDREIHDDFYREIFMKEGRRYQDEIGLPADHRIRLEKAIRELARRKRKRCSPLSRPEVQLLRHEVVDRLYKALAWFGAEREYNLRWAMTRARYTWYSYERLVSVFALSALFPARLKEMQS